MTDDKSYNPLRNLIDELPPHDLEAEWSVVACLAMDGSIVDEITAMLNEDDFYDIVTRSCYRAVVELRRAGKKFDAALLLHRVRKNDKSITDSAIDVNQLKENLQCVPTASNYEYYVQTVLDCSIRRALIVASVQAVRESKNGSIDPMVSINHLSTSINKMQQRVTRSTSQSMGNILQEAMALQSERLASKGKAGIPSGFADIDDITCGVPNELIVLAARPSVGKSSLGIQIAVNVAAQGKRVLFASLEMTSLELADRILSWRSNLSLHAMRNGYINQDQRRALIEQCNALTDLPLDIVDSSQLNVNEIMAHALRLKRKGDIGLIAIDYLELIQATRREQIREREVADICAGLKRMQKECGCPVLCLAQLNREIEKGAERDPKLSDLRSSGSIEQDAHQVWFLARKIVAQNPGDDRVAKFIVAKNRNGRTGSIRLAFTPDTSSFSSIDGQERAF